MSSETAIRISGLSKSYQIARERGVRATNLGEAIVERIRNPLKRSQTETFWALKEIDLEIKKGEVVGVIGRNGAGKSTLLKILSRITEPTTGRIELFGRVGSLLEVGTGFHPELTGRENIYLNGAILGMRKSEITRQFDAIVDFAGIEKFLDTPVKRYSSGMYVRLAFAVAAHLNPEILIVDEVLAVGDAEFQKKCIGKMQDVAHDGKTVLLVSHNLSAIRNLCTTGVFMMKGSVAVAGSVDDCLAEYSKKPANLDATVVRRNTKSTTRSIARVSPIPETYDARSALRFEVELNPGQEDCWCHFSIHIYNSLRENVATITTEHLQTGMLPPSLNAFEIEMESPFLIPGTYDIDTFLYDDRIIDSWEFASRFVIEKTTKNSRYTVNDVGCRFSLTDFSLRPIKTSGAQRDSTDLSVICD
jgi:lipopolysaccharide transport system ATP-binding protein